MQSPRSTSVTRRAAGLPMLILCVLSAGEAIKARPLLAHSMQTLLETAKTPLPENWDQTLDLPQVCRHGNKNEDIGPCDRKDRCGHIIVLSLPGVCGSHSAGPGAWFRSGSSCPSVCSCCSHLVTHSAQFSLLGHEECCSATLQYDTGTFTALLLVCNTRRIID